MTDDFIAGFWTGEGYFYLQSIRNVYKGKCHYCVAFSAGVHMSKIDGNLLKKIMKHLKIGKVSPRKGGCFQYRIHKRKDLIKFAERIGNKLNGNKYKQFESWFGTLLAYDNMSPKEKRTYAQNKYTD